MVSSMKFYEALPFSSKFSMIFPFSQHRTVPPVPESTPEVGQRFRVETDLGGWEFATLRTPRVQRAPLGSHGMPGFEITTGKFGPVMSVAVCSIDLLMMMLMLLIFVCSLK